MNNVNMNNDLNLFFENINDFTVNVFRSLPENSQLLTLWSEFRPFLNPENYQFPEAQKFISTIDSESNDFSTKKSSHAQKSLSEIGYDIPKDCFQFSHPIISSGRYTMDKGDGSYDDHQKKSSNSTQSSNPLITPNSTSTYQSFQEHNSGKDKLINLSREDIKIQNDMKLENIGYNNKFVISDKQDHSKDEFILPNTNLFQDSRNDYEIEFQQREYKSTNNGGSFQISDLDFGKIYKKEIHFHNGNTQKDYEKSKTIKGEIGGTEAKILTETSSFPNFSSPTVLEFITKIVDKSHISNLSSLENLYVFQRKDNQNSFYYCLVLTYFLYLLADNTTSFWLSSLYERIVMFKAKLAYYKNEEQLYESLTNGLKALIKEKSTKPGQLRPLQNLFLKLFLEDKNFQDGLIVTMKEFLIAQLESLDEKSCQSVLGLSTSQLGDQIENIRTSNNMPKEGILSFLPEILEGDVEILYVTQNKFERKIFKQKEELNEKSILSLICQKITEKAVNFYALGSRDHAEMFVTLNKEQQIKEAQKKLKDTIYYSLDSDVGELNSAEIVQKRNFNDNNFYPSKEDKKIENKTLGLQRFEKKQVRIVRNFFY